MPRILHVRTPPSLLSWDDAGVAELALRELPCNEVDSLDVFVFASQYTKS